jgi:predicted secreted hydrolase
MRASTATTASGSAWCRSARTSGTEIGASSVKVRGSSAYYSATRLAATGQLRVRGHTRRIAGLAWFDHQWGDFATTPGALRWDWFACQLDDGRDLMLAQFLDPDDHPLPGVRGGTLVSAHNRVMPVSAFTATPLGPRLHPPRASATYPWRGG